MTVQKFNALAVDANAASKTRNNLDTLALLVEEVKAIRRAMGSSSGGSGAGMLCGSATFDGANNADGVGQTGTITVTGARVGDFVMISFGVDLAGQLVTGYVSANDTVSFRLQNESGGAVDLASTTVRALVIPFAACVSANGAALAAMALTQTAGTAS